MSRGIEAVRENKDDRESKSIVLDMGRHTVESWVHFAKKASIWSITIFVINYFYSGYDINYGCMSFWLFIDSLIN